MGSMIISRLKVEDLKVDLHFFFQRERKAKKNLFLVS